jgi:hypothetical protein
MLNLHRITVNHFIAELEAAYYRTYSNLEPQFGNIITWTGRLALENIANSDALYHNVEHTVMVTLAGQAILEGKHISEGGVTPSDWMHYLLALLCHDIGYVKGICSLDKGNQFATGVGKKTITLPEGGTDVALTPYHVDRSKMFVRERFGKKLLEDMDTVIDAEKIASYIEMTRFPPPDKPEYKDTNGYGGLVRAADFIGQLGDPNYLRKTPALFYEFEETNSNQAHGYTKPGDLRDAYAKFYWNVVSPYIQQAIKYLQVTQDGKQWIASLFSHVFTAEHQDEL